MLKSYLADFNVPMDYDRLESFHCFLNKLERRCFVQQSIGLAL